MKTTLSKRTFLLPVTLGALILVLAGVKVEQQAAASLASEAVFVQVEAAQGFAAPGNAQSANIIVTVTDETGTPVIDLVQADFQVVNHFMIPGQICGFTNQITSFGNAGTGAYQIQVRTALKGAPCAWVEGDHLGQVIVVSGIRRGQAPFALSVR